MIIHVLSLWIALAGPPCTSAMSCAVACEKNDAQACAWMAENEGGLHYAARACALDDKTCDILAREILKGQPRREADIVEAVTRIRPACDRGDTDACAAILGASSVLGEPVRPALAPTALAAAQKYCSIALPDPCAPADVYCSKGWNAVVRTCEAAEESLRQPGLQAKALDRARADCKKNASSCTEIIASMAERVDEASSVTEKQVRNKELAEVVERVIEQCKAPRDTACAVLGWAGRFDDAPTLAKKIAQKKCAVEGGMACSEQARRECNGGKGPLKSCIEATLAGGLHYDDDSEAVEKRITEACIKDDKRACFAVGVTNAGLSVFRLRTTLLSGDEAFARGCKLGDAASCRATKRPDAIPNPGAPPKDALRPSETEAVQVRAAGNGAPLSRRVLVESWRWYTFDGAEDDVSISREVYELQEVVALAGLKEGADVVVWDERRGEIRRYVAVVNVAP